VVQSIGWWSRPLAFLERNRARYGKRFTIRMVATPPFVIISDPAEIKQVFTAAPDVLHPGEGARILEPVIGRNSVILLDESAHMEQRKLMLPAFHGDRIQRLAGLVDEVAERETAAWASGEPVALHPRLQALTMEVILRAVFGLDPGPRLDALRTRLTDVLAIGASPLSLMPEPPVKVGPWRRFDRMRSEVDQLLFELIDERRREHADRDDVLSMLLQARHTDDDSPMTDQELRDELMTLLVAGHETTASQLAWAFERLARDPGVVRRLAGEIDAGGDDAYLTATIHETMRRRPVIPNAAPRLVKKPIEVGGWEYPPGVCLVVNAYLVHHDRDIYEDPYAFRPERFLDESPGTYTWVPFGGGRRRCLGASFAILEMKSVLRAVVRRYEIAPGATGAEAVRRRAITVSPGAGASTQLKSRTTTSTTTASTSPVPAISTGR
jgi:cytochrome P450